MSQGILKAVDAVFNKEIHIKNWRTQQKQALLAQYSPQQLKTYVETYGSPLLLLSKHIIRERYQELQTYLPRVQHHYALKPLPNIDVVRTLNELGAYFDLASNGEVDVVRSAGVDPSRTIHSHPIKLSASIEYALEYGTSTFVFENENELEKHMHLRSNTQWFMRLSFPNANARVDLSKKFGVIPSEALALLKKAHSLGYHVAGLSFHVGSQMATPEKHLEAIEFAHTLMRQAEEFGIDTLKILDIGGGFPAPYTEPILSSQEFFTPIQQTLDELLPDKQIFSEPGRFIAGPAVTSISSVIGKNIRDNQPYYYVNDGMYNSYSGYLFDHGRNLIFSMQELEDPTTAMTPSTLAGPTCDSIDVIERDYLLPTLEVGDLLVSPTMGAYAGASHATDFNMIERPKVLVVD